MVHQISYDYVHGNLTDDEVQALEPELTKDEDLHLAVQAKFLHLTQTKERREAAAAKKVAREEAKQAQKVPRLEQKRRTAEFNHRVQEQNETHWYEESVGLRATSEDTVSWIRSQEFAYKVNDRRPKTDLSPAADESNERDEDEYFKGD